MPGSYADNDRVATAHGPLTTDIPFSNLADEHVCLKCASPFDQDCGFWNFSLRVNADNGNWRMNTLPCMCRECDAHVELSNGGADDIVADRRARLAQRHNTRLLDAVLGVDEPVERQRKFVNNRVPVLQLRSMFLGPEPDMPELPLQGYCRETELPRLFCSFARTCAFVRTPAGARLLRQRVVERADRLDTLYQVAVPDVVRDAPHSCVLVSAMLLRIVAAYDLMHEITGSPLHRYDAEPRVQWCVLQLQLFADTHIDLHLNCEGFRHYTDDAIELPLYEHIASESVSCDDIVHEVIGQSLLQRSYPHPLRALWAGELANATESLALGDIWTKVSPSNTRSMVAGFIHVFLSKSSNHRCMVRNFAKILCETFGKYESMLPFVINVLEVHKMGNFPGPRKRPRWRARLAVRRSHHLDRFEMFDWCVWCNASVSVPCPMAGCDNRKPKKDSRAHKKHRCPVCQFFFEIEPQLYIAVKEFYAFQVRCQRVVEGMQMIGSEWVPYRDVVLMAADDARVCLDRMYTAGADLSPATLSRGMDDMTDAILLAMQCNKTVQRLRKDYKLADLMLRMMNHAHNKVVVCQQWTGCQQPEDFLLAPLVRKGVRVADRRLECMNACFEPLAHLGGKRWCDVYRLEHVEALAQLCVEMGDIVTELLPSIGMSRECHAAVRDMQCNSEMRHMPDNSFKKNFIRLYRSHPVDFHLLHYFLKCMQQHDKVYVTSLCTSTAIAQAKALRARYHIMPWEPIPDDLDSLFFCRGDWRIYAELVEDIEPHDIDTLLATEEDGDGLCLTKTPFARGVKSALFCHLTGQLFCTTDASSTIARKLKRDGHFDGDDFFGTSKAELQRAKSVRTARESKRRCEPPLERVRLIGHVARIGNRCFTLCVVCASPCRFENSRMTTHGPTCGRHHTFAEEGVHTDLRVYVNRFLQQVRESTAGRDGNLFPLPVPLLCAPSAVKHTASAAQKFGCIGTPIFMNEGFRVEENIVEWNANGRNRVPIKAALREFSGDTTAAAATAKTPELLAQEEAVAEAFRVSRPATASAAPAVDSGDGTDAETPAAAEVAPQWGLSAETLEQLSQQAIDSGSLLQRVAIQCVHCLERCERKQRFVRLTIIDVHGVLAESLSGRPLDIRGPVDVWLCGNCYKNATTLLTKRNVVMAQDLYNTLKEAFSRSMRARLEHCHGVVNK